MKLVLRYDIRRVTCPKCQAVKVERVPWAETSSWFTIPFEDHVAYLAQRCDQTTVRTTMRIDRSPPGIEQLLVWHRLALGLFVDELCLGSVGLA